MAVNRFVLNGISYHGHGAINEIPGIIESKGFKEAYVRMDDDTVDVVVDKDSLTDAEVAQIEDIVKRKTGMDTSQIRINTLNR